MIQPEKCRTGLVLLALALALSACARTQQAAPGAPAATAAPSYKMTTPMPPGVAAPASVDTRLGTLRYDSGFPDEATTAKLYDNLDFQRAVQAYLLGLPAVNQAANRNAIRTLGPVNGTVPIFEQLVDSRSIFLTANDNTVYSWTWVDLKNGPLVLEVPPKVLGLIDDMWYRWVGDVGITGPDHGQGGKYLLLPPGYKGATPKGYHVVQSPTFNLWIPWRSFLVDGDPKPGIALVKKFTKIYPLGHKGQPPELRYVDLSGKDFNTVAPADASFWELLNQVVQEEPTDSLDPVTLGYFAAIGIEKGKPFAPDARMRAILAEAAAVGDGTARAVAYRMREKAAYYYANSAWRVPFLGGYKFETQPGVDSLDGAIMFFFAATGVTPAMDIQMVGKGSQYAWALLDANGKPLDGGRNYTLHLPPNIPVKDFWSVIVYSNQTRSMLQTDQRFPSVSSQTQGLAVNPDGSVDVYFGPKAPAGKEKNWVQTVPGQGWNVILRLYGPLEPWFAKAWRPGEIVPAP
ncbi:MAG: DUF1254 domain-containing protein [Solidesulfovibrio sp. DCME]|uniref:DUF1254 domain-containing protein n=1 Tax=Solidesulfovibrio sp. DCME TaxID=3447380 RepID=UPI003D105E5A